MSQVQQEQPQEISIQDLELSLQVYEIESEEKLKKLEKIFEDKKNVDLSKMFYEERSSLEIKFQNIVSDLTEFLINQEIASTDKLRKTFHKILENPLTFLFKVSRFQLFNLRLNAFDIELQPIEAIVELANSTTKHIEQYLSLTQKLESKYEGGQYKSFTQFLIEAKIRLIQDQIFIFYSYLRKGGNIIKKKFQDKIKVVQSYNKIQQKLLQRSISCKDIKTLKQLSVLNYQIYLFESTYDVLCFYLKLPLRAEFQEIFKELQNIAAKAKQNSNFDIFILIFLRYSKEIFAKIDRQGIDSIYSKYIENVLTSILALWGCRICHYQQFLQLFEKLINLHPNKAAVLKQCGQHNPNLQKDDIVLFRVHFKHDLVQKHSELLSLFKPKSIEETNNFLSILYHRILYNIDFSLISREQFLDLLQLINGNTSLNEFFSIVQKVLKEWNHSIDLTNSHKFIQSQFKYPNITKEKILQSIRLFNNICVLQSKGIQQCSNIIKNNSLKRALTSLVEFLFKNAQTLQLIKTQSFFSIFLINFLDFSKRTFVKNEEWEKICLTFSQKLNIFEKSKATKAIVTIRSILIQYPQYFTIKTMTNILYNLLQQQKLLQIQSNETISLINKTIMSQTIKNNNQLKRFKYFNASAKDKILINSQQQNFLKRYAIINADIIQPKNVGCFTFSQLQIVTNPIQFDKVMDNYYFTLDNNSKRYVQYLSVDFARLVNQKLLQRAHINLAIIIHLADNYPICLPLLCSTRIRLENNTSKRFVEVLVNNISPLCLILLKKIAQCRLIRYKNGKDFLKQEILPVLLKETIKLLNEGSQNKDHYALLSICLTNYKLSQLKIDLIQKSIELIKYKLNTTDNEEIVYILSQVQFDILKVFFQKKQMDMRKNGLVNLFDRLAWNQTRTKSSNLQLSEGSKEYKKSNINDQIMITPFAISHDFNVQQTKLQKLSEIKITQDSKEYKDILPSQVLQSIVKTSTPGVQNNSSNYKIINLTSLKYNLQNRLGKQINNACLSQGFRLVDNNKEIISDVQLNQQNNTLVQYYIKQFQLPEISSAMVIKYIHAIVNKNIAYSYIFSNYINLQKIFFALIILLRFYIQKYTPNMKSQTFVDKLINASEEQRLSRAKDIMKILTQIGYTNLWSESFNSLKQLSYYKQLLQKTHYSDQTQEQTFLSWILKLTLEKEEYKVQLNALLQSIFKTRPQDQTSLMYKISIDRILLNSIMKSLEIQNLSYISLLFHSNFNNLRLYTDQLHEGLKALNIASKNRAFNQYIQLSKDTDDAQYFAPLKLFKYNFGFFIKIQSQGYNFKKGQEQKLSRERVIKLLRNSSNNETLLKEIQKIIEEYQQQLQKLQLNIANRVKSFYLVTKLRDLSYQNSLTITLLYDILKEKKLQSTSIISKIKEIQIFSLITQLYNELVKFDSQDCSEFVVKDKFSIEKEVNLCTTRRYSHSINKIYEKCQLQFDEVYQRCVDVLKVFLVTQQGRLWMTQLNIYPPFLVKSFIDHSIRTKFIQEEKQRINSSLRKVPQIELGCQQSSYSSLVKSLRQLDKNYFLTKNILKISFKNKSYCLNQFIEPFKEHLIRAETFNKSKDGLLLLNKYKTSQKTLEEIQILGLIVGYCIYHGISIDLPLHSSIISALSFNICDSDDLIDVEFKVWQDLRNTMSAIDSKQLNLTFSYVFQSLTDLKPQRIQLIDKGTSKKVNNLNRQEYCDHVCCYLLYNTVRKQITRFLEALLYVCPLKIVSSMRIAQIHNILLNKHSNYSKTILQKHMKKRGLVLPNQCLINGTRYENSKDYQTVQWFCQIIDQNVKMKQKIWADQSNLFMCTWLGQGLSVDKQCQMVAIGRMNSKIQLRDALSKLLF